MTEPHFVDFVVARAFGKSDITNFHRVTDQLQVLMGLFVIHLITLSVAYVM
jgi:hypothetical protein